MEDLGLNPSEFRQGDEFTLLFDSHGNIREVILPEQREKESAISVLSLRKEMQYTGTVHTA